MSDIDGDFVLIKLVKERPILWDKKCFDVHERNKEWEIIGNFFNKTASWVKYRWMKLRQSFVKALKFNKTNLNNVGNFTYFHDMLFLMENIKLRKPKILIDDNIFIKDVSKNSDSRDDDDNNEFSITENDIEEIDDNDQNESEDIFKELSDDDENNNNNNDIPEKLSYIDNNDLVEDAIEEYVQIEEGEKSNENFLMKSDSTETINVTKSDCLQEENMYVEQFDVEYLTKNVNDNEEEIGRVTKNDNNHLSKHTKNSLTKRKKHSFDQSDEDRNNVYPSEEPIKMIKTEETVNTNIVNVKQLKQDKDQQFLQQQSIEQQLSQQSKVQQSLEEYSQHETLTRKETQSPQPLHINEDNNRCEDTIFGELITAVLKKMDLENKKRVKKEIMNIIFG